MSTCVRAGATFKRHVYVNSVGEPQNFCVRCGVPRHKAKNISASQTDEPKASVGSEPPQLFETQGLPLTQPHHIDGCDCMDCRNPNT